MNQLGWISVLLLATEALLKRVVVIYESKMFIRLATGKIFF